MTNKYFEAYCALEGVAQYHKSVEGSAPIKSYGRETLRHIDVILEALKQLSDVR